MERPPDVDYCVLHRQVRDYAFLEHITLLYCCQRYRERPASRIGAVWGPWATLAPVRQHLARFLPP